MVMMVVRVVRIISWMIISPMIKVIMIMSTPYNKHY